MAWSDDKVDNAIKDLSAVSAEKRERVTTNLEELDRVLGGGLVTDSVVLLGGDPGIGKSTILLQAISYLSRTKQTLYVSGEESLQQIAARAERLQVNADNIKLLAETQVEQILQKAKKAKPDIIVIDSIQTTFTENLSSAPGAVGQVRESTAQLVRYAKQTGTALFLVGHVTKEGALAGPRVLEHMVDTVLYFEGDSGSRFRCIRAVKNRFGAVNELGVFAMTDKGLQEVKNPSAIFLSSDNRAANGSVVMAAWEGSRPLLVEIQALVDESHVSNPRRVAVGLDQNRMAMLLAVLNRHANIATYDQDVFINVVGGLRINETAIDLALLMAVVSSLKSQALPHDLLVFGEVGLGGELRPVPSGQERLKEAAKHGFTKAIVPKANVMKNKINDLEIIGVKNVQQALQVMRELQ
jgi:DNA repair protein RadA/Sms